MKKPVLIIVALAVVVGLASSIFVIEEGRQAIVTRFGKPIGGVSDAGLHFKLPLLDKVKRFESRLLKWDGDPDQIPTKGKKLIWVDTTARWRIKDPLLFFKTVGNENAAQSRLDDIIDSVVRDAVSGHLLVELVRGKDYQPPEGVEEEEELKALAGVDVPEEGLENLVGREEILAGIEKEAATSTPDYGIELVDVRIKRLNYEEGVRKRVYERMISERKKVAAEYRSEGEGEKANILGQMQKELKRINSEAYRKSVEIRGDADAEAAAIYAEAFNRDPEFFAFYRSLEAYRKAIKDNGKLVLTTDSDFYRYLQKAR